MAARRCEILTLGAQHVTRIAMPAGRLGRHVECDGLHSIWIASAVADVDIAYVTRHIRSVHRSLVQDGWDSTICDVLTCEVARIWASIATSVSVALSS